MSSRTRSGSVLEHAAQRLGAAVGDAGDREALDALDVAAVDVGHARRRRRRSGSGRSWRQRRLGGVRQADREDRAAVVASRRPSPPSAVAARRTSARPRPRPTGPGGLVVTPGSKIARAPRARGRVRRRGSRSSRSRRRPARVDGHGPVAIGAERLERVVDEVADDRRQLGRREAGAQARARLDAQRHAALARRRGLAEQQRDEHRLLDPLPQAPEQVLARTRPPSRRARSPPRCGRVPRGRRSRAGGWRPRASELAARPRAP